jgi:N utilization substance protein B
VSKNARVVALEALYAADAMQSEPEVTDLPARAGRLVAGVLGHRVEIDEALEAASRGWRVERMPAVDRNVLRLAVYELLHTDTPVAVVIDEAVELAKQYSTARSGAFVNGVLGKIAAEREGG